MNKIITLFSIVTVLVIILAGYYEYNKKSTDINKGTLTTEWKSLEFNKLDFASKNFISKDTAKKSWAPRMEANINPSKTDNDPMSEKKFWMKAVFSLIFSLAALYVVLSKKYDDETKKWAFSVLTLIAGIWIGTATTS